MEENIFSTYGRIGIGTYWLRVVIGIVINLLASALFSEEIVLIVAVIVALLVLIQGIKRMHDVDRSGWYILIPIYGLILSFTPGTIGRNKYGNDTRLELNYRQAFIHHSNDYQIKESRVINGTMKRCPYCAEIIQSAAILCRFCGEKLEIDAETQQEHIFNNTDSNSLDDYQKIEYYKEIIRDNPQDAECFYWLGLAYGDVGRHDKAIESLEQSIKLQPDVADTRLFLGQAYLIIGNVQAAITQHKFLTELDTEIADELYDDILDQMNSNESL